MVKRVTALLLSFFCLFASSVFAEEKPALSLSSPAAVLMEAGTGQVLFEKNSHEARPPASVTKIMTMLLTMEAIEKGQFTMEDTATCSEFAASMGGSQVYLEPGETMTIHDLLKAVAVASGNDAAVVLAEKVAGSHEEFVNLMNKRAGELGMADTHFVNCNGLDAEGHVTSAYDIALMSRELCRHSEIFEFTSIWMDSLRDGAFGLVNTNKLIRFYEGAIGLKTGSTSVAKYCLSAVAKREGMTLIAVIMAGETSKERFSDATALLDFGFANYCLADNLLAEKDLPLVQVKKGIAPDVAVKPAGGVQVLVKKARKGEIETVISLPDTVGAPVAGGDVLGKAEFFLDGASLGTCDLVAAENVKRCGPVYMFTALVKQWLFGDSGRMLRDSFA